MVKLNKKSKKIKQKTKQKTVNFASKISKKEQAAIKYKATRQRKELIQSIALSGGVGAAIGIALFFVANAKLALAGGAGVIVLTLSYKYPRLALWSFLIYLPFSGTVTYWIGGGSPIFQIAKDGFYFPALITLIQNCKKKGLPLIIPKQFLPTLAFLLTTTLLTLLLVNGVMQLNPPRGDKPFLQGILGLKVLLGYVPLMACSYYLIRDKKDLLFFTRLHLALAIICCFLGLLQYFRLRIGQCPGTRNKVGPELYKATLDAKCLVGGSLVYSPEVSFIRLPGTFVAPWQWAWFLISNAFITFASAFSETSFFWRLGGLIGMAIVFINAVICGQRAALVLVPVVIAILLVLTGQLVNFKRFIPIVAGLTLLLFIGAATNPGIVEERLESFVSRWNAAPPHQFLINQFQQSHDFVAGRPLGRGVGRATNSTRFLGFAQLIETFQPKLLYEIGYPGMIAFQVMMLHLTWITFRAYRSVRDRNLRIYGASFWVFVAFISINPQYYPLDVDPVAVYYWVLAGVIIKLPKIDKQLEEEKQHEEVSSHLDEVHRLGRKKHTFLDPI